MRVCAEFEDHYTALTAHRHLVDEGLDPQEIEIRSPYPLPEHPIPPHRSAPMNMRPIVRCMWAIAVILGFSFVTYTQYEWAPVTVTNGHPLIAPPITMIVTYECGMITAILTTTFMFFLETFRYRSLVPPLEEDMPVAIGYIALVVGGRSADRAMKLLEGKGARSVVSYLVMFMMMSFLTGCAQFNMRKQDVIKGTEAPAQPAPPSSVRMPNAAEQAAAPPPAIGAPTAGDSVLFGQYRASVGMVAFDQTASDDDKKKASADFKKANDAMKAMGTLPKITDLKDRQIEVEAAVANWVNPVKASPEAMERGAALYQVNCALCHGAEGKGDGKVGAVCQPPPPPIGVGDKSKYPNFEKPDGYFYYNIFCGKNNMPPFGYKLTPEEISSIILHIRKMQGK